MFPVQRMSRSPGAHFLKINTIFPTVFLEHSPRGEVSLVPLVGHLLPAPFSQVILPEGLRPVGVRGQSWANPVCAGVRTRGLGLAEKTARLKHALGSL